MRVYPLVPQYTRAVATLCGGHFLLETIWSPGSLGPYGLECATKNKKNYATVRLLLGSKVHLTFYKASWVCFVPNH
jgi:hypothetical protein